MDASLVRLSKFLSLVLRHQPERIGIVLGPAGWTSVDDLLAAAHRSGIKLDGAMLQRVVAESDKQRFALSADRTRIRANQGHSLAVDLGLDPRQPPDILYHGTSTRNIDSIGVSGLLPRRRTHVHLSTDEITAHAVGKRHGHPVVLRVAAGTMHRAGYQFAQSDNGVWLTRNVPLEYILFPGERPRAATLES